MDYYRGSVARDVNHRSRNKKRRARRAYVRSKRANVKKKKKKKEDQEESPRSRGVSKRVSLAEDAGR